MTVVPVYSLDEQLAVLMEYGPLAINRMVSRIRRSQSVICELAYRRVSGIGSDEYGDESMHKMAIDLSQDELEELADCAFYGAVALWRENGRILSRRFWRPGFVSQVVD